MIKRKKGEEKRNIKRKRGKSRKKRMEERIEKGFSPRLKVSTLGKLVLKTLFFKETLVIFVNGSAYSLTFGFYSLTFRFSGLISTFA